MAVVLYLRRSIHSVIHYINTFDASELALSNCAKGISRLDGLGEIPPSGFDLSLVIFGEALCDCDP